MLELFSKLNLDHTLTIIIADTDEEIGLIYPPNHDDNASADFALFSAGGGQTASEFLGHYATEDDCWHTAELHHNLQEAN